MNNSYVVTAVKVTSPEGQVRELTADEIAEMEITITGAKKEFPPPSKKVVAVCTAVLVAFYGGGTWMIFRDDVVRKWLFGLFGF
ncbi:hypothetical protein [Paenibacillus sp. MMO-177]|uniref:hypothetical protein n=1 Tax=Paenibacillus sp. MMO-177 TaxID=3081289 RepID=UPI003019CC7C